MSLVKSTYYIPQTTSYTTFRAPYPQILHSVTLGLKPEKEENKSNVSISSLLIPCFQNIVVSSTYATYKTR